MTFGKNLSRRLGAIFLFGFTILAHGSASDQDLQKQYGGTVLTLRQFYPGQHLHFDATGKLDREVAPGAWTVDGGVRVKTISLKDDEVRILGQRVLFFFDPMKNQFRDLLSLNKKDSAMGLFIKKKVDEWAVKKGEVEIEIECAVKDPKEAELTKAMNVVFLAPGESLVEVVPDFWKSYLSNTPPSLRVEEKAGLVPLGDIRVSRPEPTKHPDPSYSKQAEATGYGRVVSTLGIIVDQDGLPQHIRILHPVGMGLDEEAVKAIRNWRFHPAEKNGKPVRVEIAVEIDFPRS